MRMLVLAEHDNRTLADASRKAVTALRDIATQIDMLVIGENTGSIAAQAAKISGIERVLTADSKHLAYQLAEESAGIIVPLMEHFDGIAAPASTTGKNILPRVAALLDVTQVSDAQAILSPDTFERPTYAGNAVEMVQTSDDKLVITLRTSAFETAPGGGHAKIVALPLPAPLNISAVTGERLSLSARPELSEARIIVSGGRGVGSKENFKLIERVADRLGAAVGASRAAVDAGFISNDYQVGQTGKVVAPELYIAVGISGAIQHLAGIKDARIIVAINKDPDAPIFQVADFGLVGDLFEILPQLESALDKFGISNI